MGESVQMGSAVKNTLRRLCSQNGWSYGVFWRFDHRNSMLLTLEDAYFEEEMGTMLGNMLLQVHMLGEGIIGQSAFTGKHLWMFSDAGSSQDVFQGDSEIHRQFSSGIKTIAVISVEPLGVVLFGSTHKILENVKFLDQTKRLFREMDNVNTLDQLEYLPTSLNNETSDFGGLFASLISFGDSYSANLRSKNSDIYDAVGTQALGLGTQVLLSNEPSTQFQHVFQSSSATESPHIKPDGAVRDMSKCYKVDNLSELFTPPPESIMNELAMAMNNHQSRPNVASLLSSNLVESDGFVDNPVTHQAHSVQNSITNTMNCSGQEKVGNFHGARNDLFGGSGLDFGFTLPQDCWEDIGQSTMSSGMSECISGLGVGPTVGPRKGLFSELGLEELLNGIGNSSSVTKSSLVDQFPTSKRRRVEVSSVDSNQVQLASASCPSRSMNSMQPAYNLKNPEEPTKGTKKRAKSGESTRPRPKDRQLIQDRLTELRKIIPNGHKPSIDVLLDRTIKYMLFLQSVTKYADKLKQDDEPKMIDRGNGVVLKDSSKDGGNGGVTWAYEVGGQTLVCPIVVEDLSPPGQMLIEMLCEDHGFFLEIADILRGFGLNILKGVMELRENKIWARFTVEASKHVTRMEIFWSLIQLLQQTGTSGIDSTNPPSNVVDVSIPVLKNGLQPPMPIPVSLAETLQ